MPLSLFLDANVVFAAAISPAGQGRALFDLAAHGYCLLSSSRYAIEEARRNLRAKYPGRVNELEHLRLHLRAVAEADRTLLGWAGEHVAGKDAPILAAAVASGAQYLVTGDKRHFGHLFGINVRSVTVTTVTEGLDRVLAANP